MKIKIDRFVAFNLAETVPKIHNLIFLSTLSLWSPFVVVFYLICIFAMMNTKYILFLFISSNALTFWWKKKKNTSHTHFTVSNTSEQHNCKWLSIWFLFLVSIYGPGMDLIFSFTFLFFNFYLLLPKK